MKYAPVVVFNLDVMISQTKNGRCQNGEKNGLKEGANGFPMLENHHQTKQSEIVENNGFWEVAK